VIVHQIPGIQRCFEYINPTENDTSVSWQKKRSSR
jgi:DNA-directed RNA polymerase I subunit RPA1